jgi:hypothetical protein
MRKLSAKEIAGVLATDGPTRYAHFVKQVADSEQVWGLRTEEGWVSVGDDDGNSMLPVWPHPDYAAACAVDEWDDAQPSAIDLDDWLDEWLVNLDDEGDQVAVFPTPQGRGVVVEPAQLRSDIEVELSRLE